MITIKNYSEKTANINFAKQPDYIKEAHKDFADYAEFYDEDKDIQEMLDNHMKLIDDIIKKEYAKQSDFKKTKKEPAKAKTETKKPKAAQKTAKTVSKKTKSEPKKTKKSVTKKPTPQKKDEKCNKVEPIKTEHYTEDVRLIRRFAGCIGKERQRRTILTIYRDFERRITERKVSRISKHAALVAQCSKKLAAILDAMAKQKLTHATMELDEKFSKDVIAASKELAIRTSVNLLKRFVGVEGEVKPEKAKVQRIMDSYERAQKLNKLSKDDFYSAEIKASWKAMKDYINGKSDYVAIEPTSLSGLDNVFCVGKPKATTAQQKTNSGVNGIGSDFNNAIKRFFSNAKTKEQVYSLGKPKELLKSLGIPNKEIILRKNRLSEKTKKHELTFTHLKNLPNQINSPILVFEYEKGKETFNVFISRTNGEGLLMCGINTGSKRVNKIEVSEINTIHGRSCSQLINWINKGLLLYSEDTSKIKKLFRDSGINCPQSEQLFNLIETKLNKGNEKSNLSGFDEEKEVQEQSGFEPSEQSGTEPAMQEPVVVNSFSIDLEPEEPTKVDGLENTEEPKSDLFTPITAEVADTGKAKIELPTDLGKFLGYVERYEYSILLRGEKGAGKSRMTYQMMNVFAKAGFTVGCFSLEIGKQSNIVKDMRDTYISPTIADRVQIADSAPNGLDDIRAAARIFDVVCIDSWGKIPNIKSTDFDDLRKEFPETMFIVIFQSTTNGTARGGSGPEYDAGIVIQVQAGGRAICEKNRYSGEDLMYLVFERRLATTEEAA